MSPTAAAVPRAQRILVRGVNWLGDAVMTTPALQRLRESLPGAHITLLTQEKLVELWRGHPSVNAVIPFSRDEGPWGVSARLRAQAFDTALVFPNSPRSALEVWLARIPQRVGYRRPWCSWLLTQPVPERPGKLHMSKRTVRKVQQLVAAEQRPFNHKEHREHKEPGGVVHQIHDYLHLAALLGASAEPIAPRLEVSAAEVDQANQTFLSAWLSKHPVTAGDAVILGLNPGAEYGPAKRWGAEKFAAVAREVSGRVGNCVWLVFGGAGDRALCEEIVGSAGGRVLNLAGRTSLRQLMALLKLCRVVLTNDTGPMHVAAAFGTPVVVPFGSTSPELTGPGLPGDTRHRLLKASVPCSPCFRRECPIDFRCMAGIRVPDVVDAVLRELGPEVRLNPRAAD